MKKILSFFLLFFLLSVSLASALEITSPFGWRTHPIFGNQRYHSGVDIAGDYGDFIPAVKAGVVSYAGWFNGYGYAITVDHDDGSQTMYAHCQELFASEGKPVVAGEIIAAVGSTGNSTGPHIHIEYKINGMLEDPVPHLIIAGWNLTYNGSHDFTRSDENEMPWDFNEFYDIAQDLRVQLERISDQCKEGLKLVQQEGKNLITILMIIDFGLSASLLVLKDNPESFSSFLVKKVLKYGFAIWLLGNWGEFVNIMILDTFAHAAITAGGDEEIAKEISDPSKIIQKGVFLVQPVFDYLSKNSGLHLVNNIHHVIIAMVLGLGILLCYIVIGVQIFLTYLQFYIISVISVIFIPFGTIKQVKFLNEKGVGAVFNVGLKLMFMTFMVSLVVFAVKDFTPVVYSPIAYLKIFLVSLVLVYFISSISEIMKLLKISPRW